MSGRPILHESRLDKFGHCKRVLDRGESPFQSPFFYMGAKVIQKVMPFNIRKREVGSV